ncbi:GGDEF domain-containing protein [Azorhizobium oxalatiphilum]|uniref:diguanylate cyclase n=1 Tax=Azorhizobium oxalatiphilum TaxID=980631 RepID=A0A917FF99_9HYPH|nr:GGDEF domain-containing protein [Azorhizobium oxalatiphilum]GGF75621.1 GGDEF domain-containing protein [Azorhizobium oxalatiphilum]
MYFINFLTIAAFIAVYFGAMLALFRARRLLGIGAFFCVLSATQFVEAYLAIGYYLQLPFGLAISPGPAALFTGKLAMLLVTYIKEDAPMARQPLYGMLLGNMLVFLLVAALGFDLPRLPLPYAPDLGMMTKVTMLTLWANLALFLECLVMFVVYERLRARGLGLWPVLFIPLALAVLVEQVATFGALHFTFGLPLGLGTGSFLGKLVAVALFALVLTWYLTKVEPLPPARRRRIRRGPREIWDAIRPGEATVHPESRRYDPLTGTFHASQFAPICGHLLAVTTLTGRPMSVLLMSIDAEDATATDLEARDAVVRRVGEALGEGIRTGDYVVRYKEGMFAVLTPGAAHQAALQVASLLRREIENVLTAEDEPPHTLSIGVATTPQDGTSVPQLLEAAERRVGDARRMGPNQVAGMFSA